MQVSIYLLDAALSGDDLALKQLNDILEEHKLNKIPQFKIGWGDESRTFILPLNFDYVVSMSCRSHDRWLVYLKGNLLKAFDAKEEAKQFVESETRKKIYGRP